MTPEDLRRALASADGEAISTCLAAVDEADSSTVTGWAASDPLPTSDVLRIYRRRADHVDAIGLPTVGLRESLRRLEQTAQESVRLVALDGERGYPHCVVFLAASDHEVIAALAVTGPRPAA